MKKQGVIRRNKRTWISLWEGRAIKKESMWGSHPVENSCGVKPHSSGIGGKAVDLSVFGNLSKQDPVGVAVYEGGSS